MIFTRFLKIIFLFVVILAIVLWFLTVSLIENDNGSFLEAIYLLSKPNAIVSKSVGKTFTADLSESMEYLSNKYFINKTDTELLSKYCIPRPNICISNKKWITNNKSNTFEYIPDIKRIPAEEKGEVYLEYIHNQSEILSCHFDPSLSINNDCLMRNDSIIIIHIQNSKMLWEVWHRISLSLYQYSIKNQELENAGIHPMLSQNHRFVLMETDYSRVSSVHDLLLMPFTKYPIIGLISLMEHGTDVLLPSYFAQSTEYYLHKLKTSDTIVYNEYDNKKKCVCFTETFWCGFQHSFKSFSWQEKLLPRVKFRPSEGSLELSKFYRTYYNHLLSVNDSENRIKKQKRILLINRVGDASRQWKNIHTVQKDCESDVDANKYGFYCDVISFEKLIHFDQYKEMLSTDILVGIHGSGLVNGIFMNSKSSILEIVPYNGPLWVKETGTVFRRFFKYFPHRHAHFSLKFHNQKHWQSPFNLPWNQLKPKLMYILKTPNDGCDDTRDIPMPLMKQIFMIQPKDFSSRLSNDYKRTNCDENATLNIHKS